VVTDRAPKRTLSPEGADRVTKSTKSPNNLNPPTRAVSSALVAPMIPGGQTITPAMRAILWEVSALLDEQKVPADVENSVWIEVATRRLRGEIARPDNIWLRKCLERLLEVKVTGEYRGDHWGAVMIAQYELPHRADRVRLLVPPMAVKVIRSPRTFARIETLAIHHMSGPAQRLYAALADRKRQTTRKDQDYTLDKLRHLFGVPGKYQRWERLYAGLLKPAIDGIAKFGTVDVTMTKIKSGRRVVGVNLAWQWKDLKHAEAVATETERVRPYAEIPAVPAAPPLVPETIDDRRANEAKWWAGLSGPEQDAIRSRAAEGATDAAILTAAYDAAHPTELRFCEVVWTEVKAQLRASLGTDWCASWIEPVKIESLERETARFVVRGRVFETELQNNQGAIREAFARHAVTVQELAFTWPRKDQTPTR